MTIYVISGPPCAGKTTYVMEHARATDLVVDLDRIAVAISGPGAPGHGHPGDIDAAAFAARTGVLAWIAAGSVPQTMDVYIVHTNPGAIARRKYAAMGAESVVLDPGRDVVEARCKAERPEGSMHGVRKWYETMTQRSWR